MADYGAPVFPFLAVGGYEGEWRSSSLRSEGSSVTTTSCFFSWPGDDYTNAKALIATFSLNNYARNNSKFKVAMQWEQEFLKIVQEYQKSPNSNFTFAYMAEVKKKSQCYRNISQIYNWNNP